MIKYTIQKYYYGFPSKVLAGYGGEHQYNIRLSADTPNAALCTRGDWVAFDEYAQGAAPQSFAGVVQEKAANGNWYVEVVTPGDALFIFDAAVIAEDFTKEFLKEENFFNEKGKTVRAYQLSKGDIIELSPTAFEGTPEAEAEVSFADGKYVIDD